MSIVYQYYFQGSAQTLTYGTSAGTATNAFNTTALNHIAITSTTDCFVRISGATATTASSTNGQYVMARTETIIPCVKATSLSVIGSSAAGSLFITEFLAS